MILIYYDKRTGLYLPDNARPQAKGYSDAGASRTKKALKGFVAQSGSPTEDINWNNYTLRQRGRILYMASPIATAAIKTNRTSVVGVGLQLKSRIDREVLGLSPEAAKQWQWSTEREWALWADRKQSCDATGVNNFYAMQQLALLSELQSGDVFGVFKYKKPTGLEPYGLRILLIEADRISTPRNTGVISSPYPAVTEAKAENGNMIYDGVEVDSDGAIVAYHICNTYPYQYTGEKREWTRVDAYGAETGLPNILHIMSVERPGQYRGVTYLAPVIEQLLQLRRYTESELMAALVQSFFTAWIKTDTDTSRMPLNEAGGEQPEISNHPDEYEMGPGVVAHLAPNEEIVFGNPNIPTSGFGAFVDELCKQTGAALELPAEVLLKSFNSNYSASRAAIMEAWRAYKMRRQWFVDDFCRPVYETWLAEAVARGRIHAPGFWTDPLIRAAWCGNRWIGPAQGHLDPVKEGKAAIMAVDRAFKTHEHITVEMDGGDWDENSEQLKRENDLLRDAGGGTYMATLDVENDDGGKTE